MAMILPIYAFCNIHETSWGTREKADGDETDDDGDSDDEDPSGDREAKDDKGGANRVCEAINKFMMSCAVCLRSLQCGGGCCGGGDNNNSGGGDADGAAGDVNTFPTFPTTGSGGSMPLPGGLGLPPIPGIPAIPGIPGIPAVPAAAEPTAVSVPDRVVAGDVSNSGASASTGNDGADFRKKLLGGLASVRKTLVRNARRHEALMGETVRLLGGKAEDGRHATSDVEDSEDDDKDDRRAGTTASSGVTSGSTDCVDGGKIRTHWWVVNVDADQRGARLTCIEYRSSGISALA
jgi:hypothetical protein